MVQKFYFSDRLVKIAITKILKNLWMRHTKQKINRLEEVSVKRSQTETSKEKRMENSKHYLIDMSIMSTSLIRIFVHLHYHLLKRVMLKYPTIVF